ncbi:hypothetical protein H257_03171 [Aphanomyces astaci]|uniref:Uncharacterized protein n=1 Tax=Aphanomyces astaci TaxID=112090 RepID=W4H0J2_APHAT|nr:hypothetical protein H257_03171 [Aphanomyces astaci]ETV85432.1 hypothetical protein H257_03171 [Aphanomyces astaci]|eukprot:XP_009825450.1 hypothetical protein H257_03171 [Aphanomyces astaci]
MEGVAWQHIAGLESPRVSFVGFRVYRHLRDDTEGTPYAEESVFDASPGNAKAISDVAPENDMVTIEYFLVRPKATAVESIWHNTLDTVSCIATDLFIANDLSAPDISSLTS